MTDRQPDAALSAHHVLKRELDSVMNLFQADLEHGHMNRVCRAFMEKYGWQIQSALSLQRTIDALRHDLERAMANHNADLNGDDARDAALVAEVIAAAREIPGMAIKQGARLHPPRLVAALAAYDAAMQRTKGSG